MLFAPAPAGGLTTSGYPTSAANPAAAAAESASRYRAHGTPAARSTDFICALSRKLRAVAASMPGMPSCSRTCAERHLQLLEHRRAAAAPGRRARSGRCDGARRSARRRAGRRSASARPARGAAGPGRRSSGSQVIRASSVSGSAGGGTRRTASSRRAGRARQRRRPPCLGDTLPHRGSQSSRGRGIRGPGRSRARASASIPGMNVVFVEPFFPSSQRHFARALAEAGATVIGIGEYPADALDGELKGWLHHYEQVRSVTDVGGDDGRGPLGAGQAVGGPARGHDRGAHHARRAGQGGLHDPGHVGADGLAVPGQAVDEAGAARGGRADGRLGRGEQRRRGRSRSPSRWATR